MMWISYAGKELLRKKIMLVALLITIVFLGFLGFGMTKLAANTDNSGQSALQIYLKGGLVLALSLYFAQLIAAFYVLFSAMGSVSGEIENGLLLAPLARPVPRWQVYLGKWGGLAFWSLLYNLFLYAVILLEVHLTFRFPLHTAAVVKGFGLFEGIALLLLAMTLLGSTFLPALGNGAACAMLLGLSMFSGLIENVFNADSSHAVISNLSLFVSLLEPTDSVYRRMIYELLGGADLPWTAVADQALGPFSVASVPSAAYLLYAAIYMIAMLAAGIWLFRRKDIA